MKKLLTVFPLCVCLAIGCIQEEYFHSSYFQIRPSFRLTGHLIRKTFAHSFLMCVHYCMREPRCVSINYKNNLRAKGECELNSEDAITLVHDDGSNYATMECAGNSIDVAKSQVKSLLFPVASTSDYVILRDVITSPLAAITVCLWMRTNDTTSEGTPFSYSANGIGGGHNGNEILIHNYKNFNIFINGERRFTNVSANDGNWRHICITWESISGSWALYKDAQIKAQGSGLRTKHKVKYGGVIVLAQEQDSDGGSFQKSQSFVGEMTKVNVWSRVLTANEILQMSKSCAVGRGDVMQWSIAIENQTGDNVKEVSSAACV